MHGMRQMLFGVVLGVMLYSPAGNGALAVAQVKAAQMKAAPGVLSRDEAEKLMPPSVFYAGQSQIVAADGQYRLYLGRNFVTIAPGESR